VNWHRFAARIVFTHRPLFGLSSDGVYETICRCGERWTSKVLREDEQLWANHVGVQLELKMPVGSGRGSRHVAPPRRVM
jgi:hypothetical protein